MIAMAMPEGIPIGSIRFISMVYLIKFFILIRFESCRRIRLGSGFNYFAIAKINDPQEL
jgi:hypothetical protein